MTQRLRMVRFATLALFCLLVRLLMASCLQADEKPVSILAGKPNEEAKPWDTPTRLALFMAQKIETAPERAYQSALALRSIALAQLGAGDKEQALATLKQGMGVTQRIEKEFGKVAALSLIASIQARSGDKEQALVTLEQAMAVAQQIKSASIKVSALRSIASGQDKAGDKELAFATVKQAVEVAQQIKSARLKSITLSGIVSALPKVGDKVRW